MTSCLILHVWVVVWFHAWRREDSVLSQPCLGSKKSLQIISYSIFLCKNSSISWQSKWKLAQQIWSTCEKNPMKQGRESRAFIQFEPSRVFLLTLSSWASYLGLWGRWSQLLSLGCVYLACLAHFSARSWPKSMFCQYNVPLLRQKRFSVKQHLKMVYVSLETFPRDNLAANDRKCDLIWFFLGNIANIFKYINKKKTEALHFFSLLPYIPKLYWPAETEAMVSPLCLCVATRKIFRHQSLDPFGRNQPNRSKLKVGTCGFLFFFSKFFLYPMSVQSVKERNGCTLATAHKKISAYFGRGGKKRKVPSLAGAE